MNELYEILSISYLPAEKQDHSLRQSTYDIFILHFRTSIRTTEVDYRLAAAIAPRATNKQTLYS